MFREAFGENDPNKMPSGGGVMDGGGGLVNQFISPEAQMAATASRIGGQAQPQRQQQQNTAVASGASRNPAFSELSRRDGILKSALVESLSRAGGVGGVGGAGSGLAQTQSGTQMQQQPQPVQLTMARSAFGGAKVPHYDYNGVSVALPDGIDVNDQKAVAAEVAKQNEMIDMFNSMNEEDEEV